MNFSLYIFWSDFKFINLKGKIEEGNECEKSENEIIVKGNKNQKELNFLFMNNNGINLSNFGDCLDEDFFYLDNLKDFQMVEEGINSAKVEIGNANIISIKDVFNFNGNKAIVKTYVTYFCPRYYNVSSSLSFRFSFRQVPDFNLINYKNTGTNGSYCLHTKKGRIILAPNLFFEVEKYFITMELEYSFSLEYEEEDYFSIAIEDRNLIEGCLYELYVKKDKPERRISFFRDLDMSSLNEYDYVIKTPYKKYDDDYHFNYLYVYQ